VFDGYINKISKKGRLSDLPAMQGIICGLGLSILASEATTLLLYTVLHTMGPKLWITKYFP
jgi:hypothetical protein